ncbi:hypothetical protein [Pseudomonas sp. QC2]|uniref:hypothetical protein n=1 Tax=Pseudomonas sp. QC2 TaxID=2065822 RepID=UPI00130428BF|nr:hypothetical protein [Pseudomonas sp. QC2]
MSHPFFYSSLLRRAFKQITAILAAKILLGRRALNFPGCPRPHPPDAGRLLIFQRAFKVTRGPVKLIVQRATINKRGAFEKGRYLPLIQRNVTGSAAFGLFGVKARDANVVEIQLGG